MKTCCKCKINKCDLDFCKNRSTKDGLQKYCKECKRLIARKWYESTDKTLHKMHVMRNNNIYKKKLRKFIFDYLCLHPCVDCGEKDILVLQFDHVMGDKKYNVCNMIGRCVSKKKLQTEINKCQIRCCNCHARKTAKQFNTHRYCYNTVDSTIAS
jgi:hypothetical protein